MRKQRLNYIVIFYNIIFFYCIYNQIKKLTDPNGSVYLNISRTENQFIGNGIFAPMASGKAHNVSRCRVTHYDQQYSHCDLNW